MPRGGTVGGARRQADAQVAGAPLLHERVRSQVLPEGDHRFREHARRGQDHLRRLLPVGTVTRPHLPRTARRAVPRPRLAEVPARECDAGFPPRRGPVAKRRRSRASHRDAVRGGRSPSARLRHWTDGRRSASPTEGAWRAAVRLRARGPARARRPRAGWSAGLWASSAACPRSRSARDRAPRSGLRRGPARWRERRAPSRRLAPWRRRTRTERRKAPHGGAFPSAPERTRTSTS